MKNRNFIDYCKNAIGTVFLLAAAFLVCSTLVSMRAVLAEPVPVEMIPVAAPQTARTGTTSRAVSRANPRGNTTATRGTSNRSTSTRTTAARTATAPSVMTPAGGATSTVSRATGTSRVTATGSRTPGANRTIVSRGTTATTASSTAAPSRGVTARTVSAPRVNTTTSTRGVRARTATTAAAGGTTARVSLQGSAMRSSKSSNSYYYMMNKLNTNSSIVDPSTNLISAEAYNNCLESYYTCMDEICTARNEAQGRCACAARTKSFAAAEAALETANEELITVSGQLALLLATKGKEVTSAFTLTDAEKVMNCASWFETQSTKSKADLEKWCTAHMEYTTDDSGNITASTACTTTGPTYCKDGAFGSDFKLSNLNGSSSEILAQITSYVEAKDMAKGIDQNDEENLWSGVMNMVDSVGGLGYGSSLESTADNTLDGLANTWGYELFQYAHNNVCGRVLDSCFSGIYEACGTPPSGFKCADGSSGGSCPYNYNSKIKVDNSKDEVNIIEASATSSTSSSSAICFGYTSGTTDPYAKLRGPVADARRGIMQKYLLDANAACDTYGEQLRQTAQKLAYSKVTAQQALQQKRLEFAQEEEATIAADYKTAINNFTSCLDEIYECYVKQEKSNPDWSTSRVKTYCSQVSNAPHCYETMICEAPNSNLLAVIDRVPTDDANGDLKKCTNTTSYKTNTCRNVVTMSEILSASYTSGAEEGSPAKLREECLGRYSIDGIRNWKTGDSDAPGWADNESK